MKKEFIEKVRDAKEWDREKNVVDVRKRLI